MNLRWTLSVFAVVACSLGLARPSSAEDAFSARTIELRSGNVTLQPTQARPANQRVDRSLGAGTSTAKSIEMVPAMESSGAGERAAGDADVPKARDVPLGQRRLLLAFERRPTKAERDDLAKAGIVVGDFVKDTVYTAKVTHDTAAELVRASEGINKVLQFGGIQG